MTLSDAILPFVRKNKPMLLSLILLVFYVSEAFSKYCLFLNGDKSMLPRYIKIFILVMLSIYLFYEKRKVFFAVFLLILIFIVGQITLSDRFSWHSYVIAIKYIYPIILFYVFAFVGEKKRYQQCLTIFEYLILFQSIITILGFIFQIHIFQTYKGYHRFGYNGLMITSATGTYFYMISILYFLLKYKVNVVKQWRFIILITASCLIGTKSVYLTLFFCAVFYLIFYLRPRYLKVLALSFLAVTALCFSYYLFFINSVFAEIRLNYNWMTSILSFRDQLFINQTLPYIENNWSFINYLFGGTADFELRPQMELLDLFFFWGLIGGLFYLYVFIKSFVDFKWDKTVIFSLILIALIAFLSGNFFYNASIPIYLLILRESILATQNPPTIQKPN